ncbi:hypothetical protein FPV67DRAFT_1680264 [Lyophyllum atratum]|nr:hypothetical protein FPV67DRAFT_1680264 [Lyophyllum atratum]
MGAIPSVHSQRDSDPSERDFDDLDLYEVLEVHEGATEDQIKKAYYKKSREHHPDKNLNDVGATKRFTRVLEAYQTLMDDQKRAAYDYSRSQPAHAKNHTPSFSQDEDSFAKNSRTNPQKNDWLEWLTAFFAILYHILNWLTSWSPPLAHFVYEEYLAETRARGLSNKPGISIQDIVNFIKSLPRDKGFDMRSDHDERGLFAKFDNFFQCLALDERGWGSRDTFPRFGCAHYVWSREDWDWDPQFAGHFQGASESRNFYDSWSNFHTSKTFEWVAPDNDPTVPWHIRNRNKLIRNDARQCYNRIIQTLVKSILEVDPRYLIHLARVREKAQRDVPETVPNTRNPGRNERKKRRNRKKKNS